MKKTFYCPTCDTLAKFEFVGDSDKGAKFKHYCGMIYTLDGEFYNGTILYLKALEERKKEDRKG